MTFGPEHTAECLAKSEKYCTCGALNKYRPKLPIMESPIATLRDQFAMEIAPALISLYGTFVKVNGKAIAKESYEIADAMLKAREE